MPREHVQLIPQRLRLDDEPLARHHPHLAFEGEMVRILRHRDTDGEFGRIPTARCQLRRTGRGHDGAVARAAVLLAQVVFDVIRELDRGHTLRRLVLTRHRRHLAATRGAGALIGGELVANLQTRQGRLRARAVPRTHAARRLHSRRLGLARKDLGARLLELLPKDEFELFRVGDAAQTRELRGQLQILGDEALILAIEQAADLAQRVDIALVREFHHLRQHLIIGSDPAQAKSG